MTDMATRSMPTVSCLPASAGDLELAADAVGARHEDGMAIVAGEQPGVVIEAEQAGEAAECRRPSRTRGVCVRRSSGAMPARVCS